MLQPVFMYLFAVKASVISCPVFALVVSTLLLDTMLTLLNVGAALSLEEPVVNVQELVSSIPANHITSSNAVPSIVRNVLYQVENHYLG